MKPARRRVPTRVAALAVVAVLGVSACDSQPSAKRVAEDLVKSLPGATDEERECMLDVIDGYTKDELEEIGDGISASNSGTQNESAAALAQFERDLAACR